MSAYFDIEEGDIVRLVNDGDKDVVRTGWINVGPHALKITFDPQSENVTVEGFARTEERDTLARFSVQGSEARERGGVDPDEDDEDDASQERP